MIFRTCAITVTILSLIFFTHLPALAEMAPREFLSGYAGSLPADPSLRARTYFNNPDVRRLIYQLESGPLTNIEVNKALKGSDVEIDDLIRVRLIQEKDGYFYIAFNYFTADDMRAVHEATEKYIPRLVAAYAAKDDEFNTILSSYSQRSVKTGLLKFVLIAGMSLNWDGLDITLDKEMRRTNFVSGDNPDGGEWQYSFWAAERVDGHSNKGYFWGSSTFPGGPFNFADNPVDFSFSSFGDPYSDPRMNFPDLLYIPGDKMPEAVRGHAQKIGLADREELGVSLENALGLELARPVSAILFALREKPHDFEELYKASGITEKERTAAVLDLLVEIGYIEKQDKNYVLIAPVFDYADAEMLNAALKLSRNIVADWLDENYTLIRDDLSGLTGMENGVPYESLFTQIWHEFFGRATHDLVAAGLLEDPYGPAIRYQGSFSLLWRMRLYDFTPG
ncbi:MAG: hypothetical protein AAF936_16615 [Pseudomonadota bacterium]